MKYRWIIGLILFFVVFSSCNSNDNSSDGNCLEVKMIETLCGQAVLQVVNPNLIELKLQYWTDGEGVMYENVFSTMMPCNADQHVFENGSQFYIEIIEAPITGDCVMCLALLADAPEIAYHIKVVESCN